MPIAGFGPLAEGDKWNAVGSDKRDAKFSTIIPTEKGYGDRLTRNVDQVLHPLGVVLGRVLDRDHDDGILDLLHEFGSEDVALEVAPDRRQGQDDPRVTRLADDLDNVAQEPSRLGDPVFEDGRVASPRVGPDLRQDGEEDEIGRGSRQERDEVRVGEEPSGEDVVERVLIRVRDIIRVVLRFGFEVRSRPGVKVTWQQLTGFGADRTAP